MDINNNDNVEQEEQQPQQPQKQQQQQQQEQNQALNRQHHQQQRKKCHGNRKDQRFRRKCRARQIKPIIIEKLLKKRKEKNKNIQLTNRARNTTTDNSTVPDTTISSNDQSNVQENVLPNQIIMITNFNKRKRDISTQELKSISTIPLSSKKLKNTITTTTLLPSSSTSSVTANNNHIIHLDYRRPMYLVRSSKILFQMLNKKLNYKFKNIDEQEFIYTRLDLLDRHYCLNVDLQLWQTYFDIGVEKEKWPDQLSIMAQTHDFELCQQYLINYIEWITNQLKRYQIELTKQSDLYPSIREVSFDEIDKCLKEYVDCQRKYLSIRNNNQLINFKEDIQESELFEIITSFYPTMDQNFFINQLITIREKQSKIWKEILQLDMRILYKFLPTNFDRLQNFIVPIIYSWPVMNKPKAIQLKNQHDKIIKEAKRQWLHIFYSVYEIQLEEYDQQYQEVLVQLEALLLNNVDVNGVSLFNQIKQYMIYRTNQIKQNISNQMMPSFRRTLLQHRQRSSVTKNMIGVSPEPYLDLISNPFNTLQWHHLSLGPSCIRLNQSALRPQKQQEIKVKNEHKDISAKVENKLVEYHHIPRTHPILKGYSNQLHNYIYHCYFTPLTYKDHIQAQEQAKIAASIRKIIKRDNLIIRVSDKGNNFYIGSASTFEQKVQKYFTETNAFVELSYNPFNEILDNVTQLLNNLRSKKLILQWQLEKKLKPDRSKVELSHLYFNPKTHKDDIPVRPIENTIRAITKKISDYLHEIISSIFNDQCCETNIIDTAHLITKLQKYQQKGLLKPSTLFCTFDIRNLYTMLPQDQAVAILMEFLVAHGYKKVKGIPLDTIRKLASIVLKENVFVYGNKFYRQILGGAMGSSFTLTLANIFMWKWQKEFVRQQDITGEFYGRYIDDIFMTWNRSEKGLRKLLDEANTWHPNIKLEYKISQSLQFLDVLLTNNNGILLTSVYHKPTAEPYVVPFISDHPRHVFRNVIQTALTRAIRYSSTFEAFTQERRYIKLMLLYNGYPSSFIDNQFRKFFSQYIQLSPLMPFINDEKQFLRIHHKINDQPTARQSQVAMSAATAKLNNDQTDEKQNESKKESIEKIIKKEINYGDKLIVHYTHEKRFEPFKRDMHNVYDNVFKNTPAMDLKLIVGNRNRRDARNELVRKRPKPSILQNKRIKNKYLKFLERRQTMNKAMNSNITTDQS